MATGIKSGNYKYTHIYFLGSYEFTGNKDLRTASMDTPASRCEPGMSSVQCNLYRGLTPKQLESEISYWNSYLS